MLESHQIYINNFALFNLRDKFTFPFTLFGWFPEPGCLSVKLMNNRLKKFK